MPKWHEFESERVCARVCTFSLAKNKIKQSYKFFNRLEHFMDGRSILINLILIRYTRVVFDYYYWVYGSLSFSHSLCACKIKAKNGHTDIRPNHSSHKVNVFREFAGNTAAQRHRGCARVFSIGKIRILIFRCFRSLVCSLVRCFVCFMLVWRTNGSEWNSLYQKAPSSPNGNGSRLHIHHTTPNRNSILLMDNY